MDEYKELRSDDNDPLFDTTNMLYKEFPSDFRQIRYFTLLIVQSAPLEIKEIKQFMSWCVEGASTYPDRKQLFETRKSIVEAEMVKLQKTLDMLNFKCWYYETAIQDGNEERLNEMLPDKLPPDIQKLYDNAHK